MAPPHRGMTFDLTCERGALLDVLVAAGRAATGRSSVAQPVLRLRLSGGRLKATGTDRDLTISAEVAVDGPGEGVVVVPAKLLADVVRALEGQVALHQDRETLEVEAGRAHFLLRTHPPEDFPRVSGPDAPPVTLASEGLAEALGQVVRAVATEESRPVLQGVLVEATAHGARFVATDSYRLALRDLDGLPGFLAEGQQVVVPGRALAELQRLLADGPEAVEVRLGDKEVRFDLGTTRLTARLIEGEFPFYGQIVPAPAALPNRLVVGRDALLGTLRRVRLLSPRPDQPPPARLDLSAGTAKASLVVPELGEAAEELEAKYEGEDMAIAFNPAYLADGVEATTGDEVVLEMGDPTQAAVLRSRDRAEFSYVIMPVRVA